MKSVNDQKHVIKVGFSMMKMMMTMPIVTRNVCLPFMKYFRQS